MISHARPLLDPRPAWCRVVALVGPAGKPTGVRTACRGSYEIADCETTETEPAERCGGCAPRQLGLTGLVGTAPTTAEPPVSLFNLDCIAWLQSLPSASVDLVVTDPAYESLEKHRKVGTTTRLKHSKSSSNDWFSIFPNERFGGLFVELYRVLKPDRHCYMYCDAETMFVVKPIAEAAGFRFAKPLVWDKQRIGMGYHYRARYEFVLFFEKGKRALNDLGQADVIVEKRVQGMVCDRCNERASCESHITALADTSKSSSMVTGESNIESSGSGPMVRSRTDTRSITSTRSRTTTDSKICSSSILLPTSESTPGANCEPTAGGSRAACASSSNPSPSSTGTSTPPGGNQPLDGAGRATSRRSSTEKSVCGRCGGPLRRAFPTEKPVAVSEVLVAQSSQPGELVIDPFVGSGSVGVAAARAGRRFAGCDLSADAVELARVRITGAGRGATGTGGECAGTR